MTKTEMSDENRPRKKIEIDYQILFSGVLPPSRTKRRPSTHTMPATQITIPRSFTGAIGEIAAQARETTCRELATKFGFDPEEALAFLKENEPKLVQKRGAPPKKAVKAKSSEEKPKRALTGYLYFSQENREQIRASLTEKLAEGEKLMGKAVVTALAAEWAALDDEARADWKAAAKQFTEAAEQGILVPFNREEDMNELD